jgi:hypothetical protein
MPKPLTEQQERALSNLVTEAFTRPTVAQLGALYSRGYVDEQGRVTTLGLARFTLADGGRHEQLIGASERDLDRAAIRAQHWVGAGKRIYADVKQTVEVRMRARRAKITLAAIDLVRSGRF